mmetsp:Transcript_99639/g.257674  ORF Transcript_99639/g.257674 Transcript_99639/m.257674 type:complete len:270 (+) Transcript_99639:226-1035(+)
MHARSSASLCHGVGDNAKRRAFTESSMSSCTPVLKPCSEESKVLCSRRRMCRASGGAMPRGMAVEASNISPAPPRQLDCRPLGKLAPSSQLSSSSSSSSCLAWRLLWNNAQDNAATASACCISCAISNAVTPCTFFTSLLQTGSSCFTTSALPLMAAHMSGVAPVLSTCDGSACAASSTRTMSALPACAAYISAVFLSSSTTSLPNACKPCLTFSMSPSVTAFKKGDTLSCPSRISQTSRFSTLPLVTNSEGMRKATQNSQEPVISRCC